MTKDEARLDRSINNLLSRSDAYFAKMRVLALAREKEFEQYCYSHGLLYSPLNI